VKKKKENAAKRVRWLLIHLITSCMLHSNERDKPAVYSLKTTVVISRCVWRITIFSPNFFLFLFILMRNVSVIDKCPPSLENIGGTGTGKGSGTGTGKTLKFGYWHSFA
jgi:hypothetical protein